MPGPKAPPPPKHYVEPKPEREEPLKPHRMRFSLLRPFRYAYLFTKGTLEGTLDSMACWVRRGAFFGTIGMMAAGVAYAAGYSAFAFAAGMNLPMLAVLGLTYGVLGGAIFGATLGAVTGGFNEVQRCMHREHAEDTMAKNQEAMQAAKRGPTTAQIVRAQKRQLAIEADQTRDLTNEISAQNRQYHRDQVMERRAHHAAQHHQGGGWF